MTSLNIAKTAWTPAALLISWREDRSYILTNLEREVWMATGYPCFVTLGPPLRKLAR